MRIPGLGGHPFHGAAGGVNVQNLAEGSEIFQGGRQLRVPIDACRVGSDPYE